MKVLLRSKYSASSIEWGECEPFRVGQGVRPGGRLRPLPTTAAKQRVSLLVDLPMGIADSVCPPPYCSDARYVAFRKSLVGTSRRRLGSSRRLCTGRGPTMSAGQPRPDRRVEGRATRVGHSIPRAVLRKTWRTEKASPGTSTWAKQKPRLRFEEPWAQEEHTDRGPAVPERSLVPVWDCTDICTD